MLNEKKIRLMTKLSLFEKKEKASVEMDKYYKLDYVRFQIMKTLICVTIGYGILVLAVGVYYFHNIIDSISFNYYKTVIIYIAAVYILVIAFYGSITGIVSYFTYEKEKNNIKKYKKNLKALRLLYKEESSLK